MGPWSACHEVRLSNRQLKIKVNLVPHQITFTLHWLMSILSQRIPIRKRKTRKDFVRWKCEVLCVRLVYILIILALYDRNVWLIKMTDCCAGFMYRSTHTYQTRTCTHRHSVPCTDGELLSSTNVDLSLSDLNVIK